MSFPSSAAADATVQRLMREHLELMASGDLTAADRNVSVDFFNPRCSDEPMDTRARGPQALRATIRWLHRAFADMRFEFHEILVSGDRAVARVTLHGQRRADLGA
jgi:ketosteroid isomerase-like protein